MLHDLTEELSTNILAGTQVESGQKDLISALAKIPTIAFDIRKALSAILTGENKIANQTILSFTFENEVHTLSNTHFLKESEETRANLFFAIETILDCQFDLPEALQSIRFTQNFLSRYHSQMMDLEKIRTAKQNNVFHKHLKVMDSESQVSAEQLEEVSIAMRNLGDLPLGELMIISEEVHFATQSMNDGVEDLISSVQSVMKSWKFGYGSSHLRDDIAGAVDLGVTYAAYRYNPRSNITFRVMAKRWISENVRQMRKDLESVIYVPVEVQIKHNKIKRIIDNQSATGIKATFKVLANELNMSVEDIVQVMKSYGQADQVEWNDELFARDDELSIEDEAIHNEASDYLREGIKTLSAREQLVLQNRFYAEKTLESVGQELELTKERVRQIEIEAKAKLKAYLDGKGIESFSSII